MDISRTWKVFGWKIKLGMPNPLHGLHKSTSICPTQRDISECILLISTQVFQPKQTWKLSNFTIFFQIQVCVSNGHTGYMWLERTVGKTISWKVHNEIGKNEVGKFEPKLDFFDYLILDWKLSNFSFFLTVDSNYPGTYIPLINSWYLRQRNV